MDFLTVHVHDNVTSKQDPKDIQPIDKALTHPHPNSLLSAPTS